MTTLEEVIERMQLASDVNRQYREEHSDALHYLKMYRSDQLEWEANRKAWDLVEEDLISARMKYIAKLKALGIGALNAPLTWEDLFGLEMIGKPVWSEAKRGWMLLIDSALDNRSWVDLVDASGKQVRLGPHDLEKYQLYRKEEK